jgi:hypothetical protein
MNNENQEDSGVQAAPSSETLTSDIKRSRARKGAYISLAIIIAALVMGLVYFWQRSRSLESGQASQEYTVPVVSDVPAEPLPQENAEEIIDKISDDFLDVKWEKKLTEVSKPCAPECEPPKFLVGVVAEGDYKNQKLYLEQESGLGWILRYFIIENDKPKYFGENVKFKGIDDLPETINLPGTNYKLQKKYRNVMFQDVKIVKKWFTDPKLGDFYLTEDGCLMVELPDHTAVAYDLVLPFASVENGSLDVTFTNGKKNTEAYIFNRIVGCGALCYYLAEVKEAELKPDNRLTIVARTPSGENFFQINDSNDRVLRALYNDKNTVAYYSEDFQQQSKNKYTYQQFINYRPLLYWKDPLGRWIEFKNQRFIVAAEMCKPVIYLYPERTTKLNVQVYPNGGFTYTNPKYGNDGWNVIANPDGSLKDLATGERYRYLFWEAIGLNYPTTDNGEDKGWVVKREDMNNFFDKMLPQLGMRGQEIVDFKHYWVHRLQAKPYYHLAFLKQTQFDEIAPLEIGPTKPDSVIRVMMTAGGLDQHRQVEPQTLEKPAARRGFTVVEWGGVVLK